MSFNNRNNLPNTSAPWGREVEQRIESAERNISQNSLESSNGLSSVSNTLTTLSNTLNTLAAQQTVLTTQQTMLVEQQTMLVEQQELLAANSEVFRVRRNIAAAKSNTSETVDLGTLPLPQGVGDFMLYVTVYPYAQNISDFFEGTCALMLEGITQPSVVGPTRITVDPETYFAGHISGSVAPVLMTILNTEYIEQGDVTAELIVNYSTNGTPFAGVTGIDIEMSIQPRYSSLN